MEPFHQHVFVCTQSKPEGVASCPNHGSLRILQTLERELDSQGLDEQVQVTTCGCLGVCENGPVMITYPEGIWYRGVREEDVPEIVDSHLRSGKVVSRLVWSDAPAMKAEITESRNYYRAVLQAKDEAGTLPDGLNEMIRSFMPSRAVLTALELDVFTAVASGASAEQVAQTIHADPRATEMLLNALVSLKLLDKKEGRFFNTVAAARFFCEGSRDNARGGLMHTAHLWRRWTSLTECVRAGTSVETGSREERSVTDFIAAMDRNAQERADAVVRATGIQGITRMLDLGGGSGAYSIAFARAVPGLMAEILDRSDVLPLTQEYIRKAGLAGRIATRAGDMLCDPLGEDYDLILASAICHMFSPEENRGLFRRVRQALGPKEKFVVQDFILEPDKTVPLFAALFSLNMLVGTQAGSSYSEPEYASWLRDAGFSDVRRVRLPGPVGLMIAAGA
jgi:(2Fe-2S) ferredoxin/ubiquinone/menaquinone biosynthesis C-methylase UbiE